MNFHNLSLLAIGHHATDLAIQLFGKTRVSKTSPVSDRFANTDLEHVGLVKMDVADPGKIVDLIKNPVASGAPQGFCSERWLIFPDATWGESRRRRIMPQLARDLQENFRPQGDRMVVICDDFEAATIWLGIGAASAARKQYERWSHSGPMEGVGTFVISSQAKLIRAEAFLWER